MQLRQISWLFFGLIIFLALTGIALLYSTSEQSFSSLVLKQIEILLMCIPIMLVVPFLDVNFIYRNSYWLYLVGIMLLIMAELIGYKAMGAQRWIRVGGVNIQPAEFMKIFLILALARYFHDIHPKSIPHISKILPPVLLVLLPFALILKQPNLGTALIILLLSAAIFFVSGIKIWKFVIVIIMGLAALPILWLTMHNYQKQRVLTFLNPEQDPLGAGYNIIQSIISIGSGGFIGKGFGHGSQSQLSFLPEKETDFIFAVLAEEFGLLGVILVLVICIVIIGYCYVIAFTSANQFGRITSLGIATAFTLHLMINTAMISGLIPASGIPFPLLSYGGSNLMAFMIGFGLVQNCNINRHIKLK